MRSAEHRVRALLPRVGVILVVLAASGCATVSELRDKVVATASAATAAVTPAPAASSAAPATSSSATAAPRPAVVDAPVSAAVQKTYDDANRALRAGRTADAERGYRALVQSNPELGGPHANLGLIQRRAGKLPEAAAEFELAVKANPAQPVYLNQLGISYRQLGQFDKARSAYERAIAADPAYAAPLLNLGILNDLYLGDAKRAAELYERYLALSPSGDAVVTKWVAELKNRKAAPDAVSRKEKA